MFSGTKQVTDTSYQRSEVIARTTIHGAMTAQNYIDPEEPMKGSHELVCQVMGTFPLCTCVQWAPMGCFSGSDPGLLLLPLGMER